MKGLSRRIKMLKSKTKQLLSVLVISTAVIFTPLTAHSADKGAIEVGKKLAFKRSKGNCLACHAMKGGNLAGTIGPMIVAMKLRYPDRQKLFDKLWGKPGTEVKDSMMPPFGKNGILTDNEINKIVDFIYEL